MAVLFVSYRSFAVANVFFGLVGLREIDHGLTFGIIQYDYGDE